MDQIEKICERLELGEPLSTICKDKAMPSVSSVYKKCRADNKLQEKIMNSMIVYRFYTYDPVICI